MLGHTWRLRLLNTQNQAVTVVAKAKLFNFSADGSLMWSTEQTLIASTSLAAATGTAVSATMDNSTNGYIGAELTVEMTAAAATNGTGAVTVRVERSTDAGTTWPTQELGSFVGAQALLAADSTNARRKNYLIR